MKLILKEDVENLGSRGDLVNVKDGFGRNFLIPQGKAEIATPGLIKDAKERVRLIALKKELTEVAAKELAAKIEETPITIAVKTGEEGRLHGTVTTQQIANALSAKDIIIDRKIISIDGDISNLGEYNATVTFTSNIKAALKIWVVKA